MDHEIKTKVDVEVMIFFDATVGEAGHKKSSNYLRRLTNGRSTKEKCST